MQSNTPLGLLDVVCGEPVDMASVHRYVHGGALFCFCSDECLARFIVDPPQFVLVARGAGGTPARIAAQAAPAPMLRADAHPVARRHDTATAAPAAVVPAQAPHATMPDLLATPAPPATPRVVERVETAPAASHAAATLGALVNPRSGSGNVFSSLFAWREKRLAAQTCNDLLKLHKVVAARHPGLSGPALYREVVAAHNGGDRARADAVVENAEQSFAIWPVQRALRFADVVHYVAAAELLGNAEGRRWIQADMKRIVAARIPHDL